MAQQQNKEIARRAYQVISDGAGRGDLSGLDALVASDVRDHNPESGQGPGLQGVKDWFSTIGSAFPDLQVAVEDLIAEGDKVVARTLVRGTHSGDFQGIPATRKQVSVQVIDILRVDKGTVVERWGLSNQMGMLQLLGVTPT